MTGQEVNRTFINSLLLIDRNVMDLAFLAPGVIQVDDTCPGFAGNNFISNGGRNATTDVLMDGVTANNYEQNGGIQVPTYTLSPEAVEEFNVQQSNFSAEFGFTGATVVNMITRSGTNRFHGSVYDFLRNNALDSNDFFSNSSGIPLPGLQRNNFGGTVGGPIRKNKTFFFFDYDGLREHQLSPHAGVSRAPLNVKAILASSARATAARSTPTASAPALPANSGIPTRVSLIPVKGGRTDRCLFPSTTSSRIRAPAISISMAPVFNRHPVPGTLSIQWRSS